MQRRDLRTQWGKESGVSRDSSTVPTAAREGSQPVGAAAPHGEPSLLLGGGLGGWGEGVSLREQGQINEIIHNVQLNDLVIMPADNSNNCVVV